MDKVIKQRWLAALRSGEYRQCFEVYTNTYGDFDAVGLLAKLLGVQEIANRNTEYIFSECEKGCGVSRFDLRLILIMNDTFKYSFNEIADCIEENVE